VSDKIANCKLVQELALSTNDLRSLPEAIGGLESLVTLKLDDNQVSKSAFSLPPDFNP
jgi:Leucine-rich repeat (LRR) protein